MRLKAPCFDYETHTDCPNRAVGCRSTCEAWQVFEVAKKKQYAEDMVRHERLSDEILYQVALKKRLRAGRHDRR
jgi:hypothetical protein